MDDNLEQTPQWAPFGRAGSTDADHPEQAIRSLLRWIGENPDRDGLRDTPARVARAFEEYFSGYRQDPEQILQRTFEEMDGYDEMVVLRGIPFQSHCEHHIAPIIGRAWVAYVPDRRVVGISKLARIVDALQRAPQRRLVRVATVGEHQHFPEHGRHCSEARAPRSIRTTTYGYVILPALTGLALQASDGALH